MNIQDLSPDCAELISQPVAYVDTVAPTPKLNHICAKLVSP